MNLTIKDLPASTELGASEQAQIVGGKLFELCCTGVHLQKAELTVGIDKISPTPFI